MGLRRPCCVWVAHAAAVLAATIEGLCRAAMVVLGVEACGSERYRWGEWRVISTAADSSRDSRVLLLLLQYT